MIPGRRNDRKGKAKPAGEWSTRRQYGTLSFSLLRLRGMLSRAPHPLAHRSEEMAHARPLYQMLLLVVREAVAERIELRGLDEWAIGTLIANRYSLSDADLDRLAAYLHRRTERNALFLAEVLRSLEEGRILERDGDSWRVGDLAHAVTAPADD